MCMFIQRMKDFSICITMDCWKLARGGLFQDTEEESVITYPHLRILPITSADNPRNFSAVYQFKHPHIRILPEAIPIRAKAPYKSEVIHILS